MSDHRTLSAGRSPRFGSGRTPVAIDWDKVKQLREYGVTWRDIGKRMGVDGGWLNMRMKKEAGNG